MSAVCGGKEKMWSWIEDGVWVERRERSKIRERGGGEGKSLLVFSNISDKVRICYLPLSLVYGYSSQTVSKMLPYELVQCRKTKCSAMIVKLSRYV